MPNYFDTLADLDLADLQDMGALEMGDVGARRRRRRGRRMPGRRVPARSLIPQVPGVPAVGVRLQPLGFGATIFNATSGTLLQLQALPQRPFKGQRLVIEQTRTGTTATGLVTVNQLLIGTSNQSVGVQGMSAGAFAATAFDVNLSLSPATPGVVITLQLAITVAPSSSDRVDVSGTMFGTSVDS